MLAGVCEPHRFLALVRDFIVFEDGGGGALVKRMTARRELKRTRYDAPLLGKDGKVLPVEVISTPLRNADGAVTGVVDAITALGNQEGSHTASLAT